MTDTAERRDGSAKLKKNVSKLAFRSREKMLRTFGVGEETKDEIIDNYVHLVTRQQAQFHKFQRDVKLYLQSIIATKNAADCFYSSLNDIYDDDWSGKDMIASLAKTTDLLYSDLHAKLHAEVISLIQNHLTQCNEMKVKVQKRGRKLVDFDAARRSLQMLENSKKPEEAKLSKARDQVTHAHETYETMNTQLHQELPDLHDSRVVLSTDIIRNIASSEKSFYTDLAELRAKLLVVLANLRDAYDGGEYRIQRLHSSVLPKTQIPTSAASSATGTRLQAMGDGPRGSRSNTSASTHSFNKSESRENRELPPEPDQSNHPNDRSQRTSNYVNIDIARPPPVAKQDASVQQLNGQYSDEQNVYDTAEGSEKREENPYENQAVAVVMSSSTESPKPVPRLRNKESVSSEEVNDEADDAGTPPPIAHPSPKPRTILPPSVDEQDETAAVVTSENVEAESSVEAAKSEPHSPVDDPTANLPESQNKRRSLLGTNSLSRWVSSFSRSNKSKTELDGNIPQKKKVGLFSKAKKIKKQAKEDEVDPKEQHQEAVKEESIAQNSSAATHIDPRRNSDLSENDHRNAGDSPDDVVKLRVQSSITRRKDGYTTVDKFAHDTTDKQEIGDQEAEPDRHSIDGRSSVNETVKAVSDDEKYNSDLQVRHAEESVVLEVNGATDTDNTMNDPQGGSHQVDGSDVVKTLTSGKNDDDTDSVSLNSYQSDGLNNDTGEVESTHSYHSDDIHMEEVLHGNAEQNHPAFLKENDDEVSSHSESTELNTGKRLSTEPATQPNASDTSQNVSKFAEVASVQVYRPTAFEEHVVEGGAGVGESAFKSSIEDEEIDEPVYENAYYPNVAEVKESGEDLNESYSTNDSDDDSQASGIYDNFADFHKAKAHSTAALQVQESSDDASEAENNVHEEASFKPLSLETGNGVLSKNDPVKVTNNVQTIDKTNQDLTISVGDDDQGVYELPPSSGDTPPRHEFVGKADAITNSGDASAVGTKEILPPHFLYKAEALYPYQGSDDDELSFAKGDIIYVVEFPDPEEQDEGWQMGILRSSWEDTGATSGMAVFPENFTRKL